MNRWHNVLDSVYERPSKSLDQAIETYVNDLSSPDQIDTCNARIKALTRVCMAISMTLNPSQQAEVAANLGFVRDGDAS